jgi:hypothetical protein
VDALLAEMHRYPDNPAAMSHAQALCFHIGEAHVAGALVLCDVSCMVLVTSSFVSASTKQLMGLPQL